MITTRPHRSARRTPSPVDFPSPERLEARIAPAGLVTATFLHGLLTINGADGADHDVEIMMTGINQFRVDGHATDINLPGQTSKTYHGVLKDVLINGGIGADTFELTRLSPLKNLGFNGNAGVDSLSITNLRTGRVDIDLGTETGSVEFAGSRTAIHGALNINLGGGGTASLGSTLTTVDGDVAFTGGSGIDSVAITGATTLFKGKLKFDAGGNDDTFSASGSSLTVRGFVTMDGGPGTNHFDFAATKNIFGTSLTTGLLGVKLGVGPGDVTFGGNSTHVFANLQIDLGSGGGSAHLDSAVTTIRNNVEVTGGVGNDTLEFDGRTSIGKSVSFLGDAGDDTWQATGGLFAAIGAASMDGGSGMGTFDINVNALALGSLTVTGGPLKDIVSIIADGTIAGNTNLQLGADGTSGSGTILQSHAGVANGLKFGGTLTIDMVGATTDFLTIANIKVAKGFVAQTGDDVSTVTISRLNGRGNFQLQTGSGADVVNIDNVRALDFYVDTGIGADELRIERNPVYTGISQVLGTATILTGIGADEIRIGNASDAANLKVSFLGAMTLDAGDGANMRNDIVGSNSFASAPSIVATGGVLTETAAA